MVNIHCDGTNFIAVRSKIVTDVEDLDPSEVLKEMSRSVRWFTWVCAWNYCSLFLKKWATTTTSGRSLLDIIIFQKLCEKSEFIKKEYRIENNIDSTFVLDRRVKEPAVANNKKEISWA